MSPSWNALLIAFLIAHGLVHLAVWCPSTSKDSPFDPRHSWLLGDRRGLALGLALGAAGFLIAGGLAQWAAAGLGSSLLLMIIFFNRWFVPIQLINLGAISWLLWPALVRL